MKYRGLVSSAQKLLKQRAPEIFTAISITGVATTAVLAVKATFKAADMIKKDEAISGISDDPVVRFKERAALVWPVYTPAATAAIFTTAAIVGANKSSAKRTAAALTAYSISEKALSTYREQVVDKIGPGKARSLEDDIAQRKVKSFDNSNIIVGGGDVLCCELYTGRFFKSSMEALRKAENSMNHKINHERYVSLNEFYEALGLPYTSQSDLLGWDSDKLLVLQYSTVLGPQDEPCIAFDYNYVKPL